MQHFWYRSRFLWAVFIFFVVGLSPSFIKQVVAQSDDCGNGLPQQLSVGSLGWVIPDPPEPINVRDAPGGNRIDQIQPAEQFTVLGGPECNQTYSWWEIESETGVWGWIAEGTDHYFVEPLAIGGGGGSDLALNADYSLVISDELQCDGEPNLEIGQAVRFANENPSLFYGHPLLTNGLFPVEVMGPYYERYNQNPFFVETSPATSFYLIEGGHCVNGEFFWKIGALGYPSTVGDGRLYIASSNLAFWVSENALTLTNSISNGTGYNPPTLNLVPNTSAPIIQAEQQVAFDGYGGGGTAVFTWYIQNCQLGQSYTALGYLDLLKVIDLQVDYVSQPCMEIYPLPSGEATIRIYQPDGSLFIEKTMATHPLTISRELEDGEATLETTSVRVDIPNEIGLMTGIWQIEVQVGDTIIRRAYHLIEDNLKRIQSYCEGVYPRFLLNAFESGEKLDLVYVAISENALSMIDSGDEAPFEEITRWSVEIDDTGSLLIDPKFQPERNGYFVVVEPGANWQTNLDFVGNNNPGPMAAAVIRRCGQNLESPTLIETNRLITGANPSNFEAEYGQVVSEVEQYSFEAQANDTVTITTATYRDELGSWETPDIDVTLELYAPDGTLIAENDDAVTPQFDPLDAEIADFVIPEDGEYTLVLTSTGAFGVTSLFINLAQAETNETVATDETLLSIGDSTSALLAEQNRWQFEGKADEAISVSVESSDFDAIITLKTSDGDILVTDDDSGNDLNAYFEFTLPTDGMYVIEVSGWGNKTGEYTLEISQP